MKLVIRCLILSPLFLPSALCPAIAQQDVKSQEANNHSSREAQDVRDEPVVKAPAVKCNGGLLSISAENATLGSILNEVHRCSGAEIDAPPTTASVRIFDQLGPGPIVQVLDSLLSVSGFNYVIGRSKDEPDKIESILLMPREPESTNDSSNLSPTRRAFLQMRGAARPKGPQPDANQPATLDQSGPDPVESRTATEADRGVEPALTASPEGAVKPASTSMPSPGPDVPPNSESKVKSSGATTEDHITSMQQLFEQRQKMMQQPQAPPQP